MLKKLCLVIIAGSIALFASLPDVSLSGTVKDSKGAAIAGASVTLKSDATVKATTDAQGAFLLQRPPVGVINSSTNGVKAVQQYGMQGMNFVFYTNTTGVQGSLVLFDGNGRKIFTTTINALETGKHQVAMPLQVPGIYVLRYTFGQESSTIKMMSVGSEVFIDAATISTKSFFTAVNASTAPAVDSIIASKPNYSTARVPVDALKKTGIAIVLEASTTPTPCTPTTLPEPSGLTKVNEKLPDPFTFYDGTKLTRKDQWECRRQEILAMAEKYVYGPCPPKPEEVTGTISGGTITINCKQGSKTASFSAKVSGSGDAIAVKLTGAITPSSCKTLDVGSGNASKIQTLFGVSNMIENVATAWVVDRAMEVMDLNPSSGLDSKKVMVSGCSGCGKGAFEVGVFSHVPLTVIVESGGGGVANYRMCEWFRHGAGSSTWKCKDDKPQSIDNLESSGICGPWVSSVSSWLSSSPAKVKNLPYDQHLLLATIAPRYLCSMTNQNGAEEWCHLGGTCEALSAWAAEPVWNALGIPERMGFLMYSEASAPGHCGNPSSATTLANEFFKRVFQGDATAKTDVMTFGQGDKDLQQPQGDWKAMWVDWDMATKLE